VRPQTIGAEAQELATPPEEPPITPVRQKSDRRSIKPVLILPLLFSWLTASALGAAEPSDIVKSYRRRANAEFGQRWYTKVKAQGADLTPGTVLIRYEVLADGQIRILKVEPRDGANKVFVKICREAVEESHLDPPPKELRRLSRDGRAPGELTFAFSLAPYASIYRPNGKVAAKAVEEYRKRILSIFNERLSKEFRKPSHETLPDVGIGLSIRRDGSTQVLEAQSVDHAAAKYLEACKRAIADTTLPPPPAAALALGNGERYGEVIHIHPPLMAIPSSGL
jgi:hypothetical protein